MEGGCGGRWEGGALTLKLQSCISIMTSQPKADQNLREVGGEGRRVTKPQNKKQRQWMQQVKVKRMASSSDFHTSSVLDKNMNHWGGADKQQETQGQRHWTHTAMSRRSISVEWVMLNWKTHSTQTSGASVDGHMVLCLQRTPAKEGGGVTGPWMWLSSVMGDNTQRYHHIQANISIDFMLISLHTH